MGNWLDVLSIAWLVGLDLPHSGLLHIATHILRTCEVPFQQHTKISHCTYSISAQSNASYHYYTPYYPISSIRDNLDPDPTIYVSDYHM